jgi:hypothetical protein
VSLLLIGILVDLTASGAAPAPDELDPSVAASIAPVLEFADGRVSDDLMLRGLAAWSGLFGTITFELFGQFHNVVASSQRARKAFFDHQMRQLASGLGLDEAA